MDSENDSLVLRPPNGIVQEVPVSVGWTEKSECQVCISWAQGEPIFPFAMKHRKNLLITLYRHLHSLVNGEWLSIPPETIGSEECIQCVCQSTRGHGGFHGKLQYNFVIADIEYIICAVFQIPVTGENVHNVMIGRERDDIDCLPNANELITLHWRKAPYMDSKFEILVRETIKGKEFFDACKESLRNSWSALNEELNRFGFSCYGTLPPPSVMQETKNRVPLHFVRNIRNVGWIDRLREAHRSLYIRFVNLTGEKLSLVWTSGSRCLPLEEGQWIEFPSELVEPGCFSECGIQSEGFFGGSKGSFTYSIVGSQEYRRITISWDQRVQVFRASVDKNKCGYLSVVKHTETHNQASVHLHLLDPSNLPKLDLLSSKAILPQTLQGFDYTAVQPTLRNDRCSLPGTPVTLELIRFLRQADSGKQVEPPSNTPGANSRYACTELTLISPRTFMCSYQLTLEDGTPVPPHSHLLLEWQIGCEIFWKLFKPDQAVWLSTAVVGGIDDQNVVMSAQKTDNTRLPPFELLGEDRRSGRGAITMYSSECDLYPRINSPLAREDLLNGLVRGMQLVALGLQGMAEPLMREKYGKDWLHHECQVPKDHLWQDVSQLDVDFDLEGMMFILVSRWDELFESVFAEANFFFEDLQKIQKVSVYWSNQELSRFDETTVSEFLKHSYQLLEGIHQTSCAAKIRQLYISLFEHPPLDRKHTHAQPLITADQQIYQQTLSSSSIETVDEPSSN